MHLTLDRRDRTAEKLRVAVLKPNLLALRSSYIETYLALWALCPFSNNRCCVIEPQENKVMFSLQASLTVPAGGELRITVSCQSKNSSLTQNDDRMIAILDAVSMMQSFK